MLYRMPVSLSTLRDEAVAAVGSGDWATARQKAQQALAYISMTPSRSKGGNNEMEWTADAIRGFIAMCDANLGVETTAASGNGIFGQIKLTYVDPRR